MGLDTNKLKIKCPTRDSKHPSCIHGPCIFFYKDRCDDDGYFACSAFRDKRDCSFYMPVKKKLHMGKTNEKSIKKQHQLPIDNFLAMQKIVLNGENAIYCFSCNKVFAKNHEHGHKVLKLTDTHIQDPTKFLNPVENEKSQAQYFFDDKALKFFGNCFKQLKVSKVICMGAPRLHAFLQTHKELKVKSFLLDFDHRFYYFYNKNFAWYNMCNNHFFDANQELEFMSFLENNNNKEDSARTLIFTDPPFGCRTETITQTLRDLTQLHNNINKLPQHPLPIFWIFPYFMNQYIKNDMPQMEMCDYKVNYTNHEAYSVNRKLGSPGRLFTNVPLNLLNLPVEEGYKYCAACQCYTALENRHCKLCGTCPSKNGSTYRHCEMCGLCVKPNYMHCNKCRRCTQIEGHNCSEYQTKQRCWICLQVGHIERQCEAWKKACKKLVLTAIENDHDQQIRCLLCDRLGHNERKCPMRSVFIEETTFLGETIVKFK